MSTVWILTREINQYDQDGEYFVSVWKDKPTTENLIDVGVPSNRLDSVLNDGGGRIDFDDEWFHLTEYEI